MPVWTPVEKMVQSAVADPKNNTVAAQDYLTALQKDADAQAAKAAGVRATAGGEGNHQFLTCRDFYVAYKSGQCTPTKVIPTTSSLAIYLSSGSMSTDKLSC